MKRINIFILRHGHTKGTERHRYYGRTDIPLSKSGIRQIKKLILKADYIYSSPLKRCIQTAEIIGGPVEISNDLIEIDFGDWEGLTLKQMQRRNPRIFNKWLNDFTNFRMPRGESVRNMIRRVERFWKYIIEKHHSGNILIVTHGGPAKIIVMKAFGIPMEKFWNLHIGTGDLWVKSY